MKHVSPCLELYPRISLTLSPDDTNEPLALSILTLILVIPLAADVAGCGRHGGRGSTHGGRMTVVMRNGVDVNDVTRSFTTDEWDKLRGCGGHSYVYQRREYLSGRGGRVMVALVDAAVVLLDAMLVGACHTHHRQMMTVRSLQRLLPRTLSNTTHQTRQSQQTHRHLLVAVPKVVGVSALVANRIDSHP